MHAYKALTGGRSPFTGMGWPLPAAGRPGAWVDVLGAPALCVNGVHACTLAQLPTWLGPELWVVELDGQIEHTGPATIATRARVVAPAHRWDAAARARFAEDCAARARRRAPDHPMLAALATLAAAGRAAAAGHWSAVLAGEVVATGSRRGPEYDRAAEAERRAQADCLATVLGLPA